MAHPNLDKLIEAAIARAADNIRDLIRLGMDKDSAVAQAKSRSTLGVASWAEVLRRVKTTE
jgi:hypothetical protein